MKPQLTADQIRDLLDYDPSTGIFIWRKANKYHPDKVGQRAGCVSEQGYIKISINGCGYLAHRLAWVYVYGEQPPKTLDHINGDRADNRIANLRPADTALNGQNRRRPTKRRLDAPTGVQLISPGYYVARIGVHLAGHRLNLNLGSYPSEDEAQAVYRAAKALLHPGAT